MRPDFYGPDCLRPVTHGTGGTEQRQRPFSKANNTANKVSTAIAVFQPFPAQGPPAFSMTANNSVQDTRTKLQTFNKMAGWLATATAPTQRKRLHLQ
jgi:hypothetical protein